MWIVRLALRRPFSVAVMALLIFIGSMLSLTRMLVDIFPVIDIPVVTVVWSYNGLSAEEMERRVVFIAERAYSTTVNGIERIESRSIPGIGLMRVYFQPGSDIGAAIAQISSVSNTVLRIAPPGITPPNVLQFNASNVPVAQITASSETLSEDRVFDYGLQFIRIKLFTIPGLSTPAPFGGKSRQINIDVDREKLAAKGLSPADVVNALQATNVILPAGPARMGGTEYDVAINSSPTSVPEFGDLPIKIVGGAPVLMRDVAKVADAFATQTNMVHVDGRRATYLSILKKSDASTLAVVDAAKEILPEIQKVAPEGLDLRVDFDQSKFVRAAVDGVVKEALVSALLVSTMILLFLGSFRSVFLVSTSIPLAIGVGIIGLKLTGNSINIMTLGGMSLAIGMLVDDATVEVENIHRNRNLGKPLTVAILDGAHQIAVPAIVATLAICIVFFPVVLLTGPARFLFTPLALAVVLSMLASYVLSRTLVPTLARMLLATEVHHDFTGPTPKGVVRAFSFHFNKARERVLETITGLYVRMLALALSNRTVVIIGATVVLGASAILPFSVGTDFFPAVDVGMMKLHVRTPNGMRIEDTEKVVLDVEKHIRDIVPPSDLQTVNDMIGVPINFNLAFVATDNVSGSDAEVTIALKPGHAPTQGYMAAIRKDLAESFPGTSFYFQPADIVTQVLNFGLPSAIDIQIEGGNLQRSFELARTLRDQIQRVPGAVDVHIAQDIAYPSLRVDVDRVKAAAVGITQRDVANSVLITLASSALVAPSYFLNPINNVNYSVVVRVPGEQLDSVGSLLDTPISPANLQLASDNNPDAPSATPGPLVQTLANVAQIVPQARPSEVDHYTVQRVLNLRASVEGRDLGSVAREIQSKIDGLGKLPPGSKISLRGQFETMNQSFRSLGLGLLLAIALVYLLMVVLYQSWLDPLIIMIAVPGALVGILWALALTHTTINVESLMGAIMAVGIATSNSILMVSFANDVRTEGLGEAAEHAAGHGAPLDATHAALLAGKTRMRPVLMTALAMIIGMIPMALGHGEGGEQNAPLGRAVIGGLVVATVVTLFVVPVVYSLLRRGVPTKHLLDTRFREESKGAAAEALS